MKLAHLFLFAMLCASLHAQSAPQPAPASENTLQAPAPTAYTLPPDKLVKARALYTTEIRLFAIGTAWSFLLLLGLLYTGVSARYRDWAERISQKRFVQALVAVLLFMLTVALLKLPLRIYAHHIYREFGLSVQGWGPWLLDVLKGRLVWTGALTLLLWGAFALIRRSPRRWWFYAWLISLPLVAVITFLVPLVFDPMFNDFHSLESRQPQLVESLGKVTRRAGLDIPRSRMYEMDASSKVTTINAYVTGLGASKRVVVWDTTIRKMTVPEILFVFGHEMGHYVLNHIVQGLVIADVFSFFGLYLFYRIAGWMVRRFQQPWRLRGLDDWAALPAIFLIIGVLEFAGQPLAAAISRHVEHQADIYGLEVTHGITPNSQEVAARAFQILGEDSLEYPNPGKWMVFFFYDHPTTAERLKFALQYDPWDRGEKTKYVK